MRRTHAWLVAALGLAAVITVTHVAASAAEEVVIRVPITGMIDMGLAPFVRRAFDEGGREAWLLTTTAAPFFERAGFNPAERAATPAAILATRQAASLCRSSAALLSRRMML